MAKPKPTINKTTRTTLGIIPMATGGDQEDLEYAIARQWYDHKSKLMELTLGKEHDLVSHAVIPYEVGGSLDLYYYPNGIPGTAIATKELSYLPNQGSSNNGFQSYELVMFTKQSLDLDAARNEDTKFGERHSAINAM